MSERERIDWAKRWRRATIAAEASRFPGGCLGRPPAKGRALTWLAETAAMPSTWLEHGFDVDALDIAGAALKLTQDAARERGLAVNTISGRPGRVPASRTDL